MNRRPFARLIWLPSFLLVLAASACSEATNESQVAGLGMLYPAGAREIALGGVGIAAADGPASAWHNPALLPWGDARFEAGATYYRIDQFGYNPLRYIRPAVIWRTDRRGTIGFAAGFMSVGDGDRVYDSQPRDTRFTLMRTVEVTWAATIDSSLSAGVTAKWMYDHLADAGQGFERGTPSGHGWAIDAGILWRPSDRLSLGAALRNYGPNMQYIDQDQAIPLPTNFNLGVAFVPFRTARHRLLIATDAYKPLVQDYRKSWYLAPIRGWYDEDANRIDTGKDDQDNTIEIPRRSTLREESRQVDLSAGAEYAFREMLMIRGGYFRDRDGERQWLTYGAGVRVPVYRRFAVVIDLARIETIDNEWIDPADGRWSTSIGMTF